MRKNRKRGDGYRWEEHLENFQWEDTKKCRIPFKIERESLEHERLWVQVRKCVVSLYDDIRENIGFIRVFFQRYSEITKCERKSYKSLEVLEDGIIWIYAEKKKKRTTENARRKEGVSV